MNFCKSVSLLALLCCTFFFRSSSAHPFTTFGMQILNVSANGVFNPPELVPGTLYRLYFHFVDNLHNFAPVQLQDCMLYHQRYFHILMVSQDQEWSLHVHPDDFMDLENASPSTTLFYVDVNFPVGGTYSLAASFLFDDNILLKHREGFAQTELDVTGDYKNATYNLTTTNRYSTYAFDEKGDFDTWINIKDNEDDTNGFWAEFEIFGSTAMQNYSTPNLNSTMNYINANVCTWFKLTVYKNDSTIGTPATMVPYLAAAAHLTVALDDGGVYHAHGMFLPAGMDWNDIVASLKGMTMPQMMQMAKSDPMYNISMNAEMIGIQTNGTINCLSDEGDVVDSMMGMMDMSEWYGPSTFGSVVGMFDFPAFGVSNWRIFAYMKIQLPNGEERLIVPHFSVRSIGAALISDPDQLSSSTPSASAASTIAPLQIFVLALACIIALF